MHCAKFRRCSGSLITVTCDQSDHVEGSNRSASAQTGRLDRRLGVSGIGVDRLPDQPLGRLLEIKPEVRVQLRELPPHKTVWKSVAAPHDRRRALPRTPEGPHAITPTQGDETAGPTIWSGRLNFISMGGSRGLTSSSLALSRSTAASAAPRSPSVVAPKYSASSLMRLVFDQHTVAVNHRSTSSIYHRNQQRSARQSSSAQSTHLAALAGSFAYDSVIWHSRSVLLR